MKKAAEAYLGKLVKTSYDKKSKRLQYVYPSVVIGVDKRKRTVQSIIITDQLFVTMRAVSVGDSAGRAVGQYGIPDGVAYLKEGVLYEYNWQDAKKQKLRFAMLIDTQSKVKIILLETRKKINYSCKMFVKSLVIATFLFTKRLIFYFITLSKKYKYYKINTKGYFNYYIK